MQLDAMNHRPSSDYLFLNGLSPHYSSNVRAHVLKSYAQIRKRNSRSRKALSKPESGIESRGGQGDSGLHQNDAVSEGPQQKPILPQDGVICSDGASTDKPLVDEPGHMTFRAKSTDSTGRILGTTHKRQEVPDVRIRYPPSMGLGLNSRENYLVHHCKQD